MKNRRSVCTLYPKRLFETPAYPTNQHFPAHMGFQGGTQHLLRMHQERTRFAQITSPRGKDNWERVYFLQQGEDSVGCRPSEEGAQARCNAK